MPKESARSAKLITNGAEPRGGYRAYFLTHMSAGIGCTHQTRQRARAQMGVVRDPGLVRYRPSAVHTVRREGALAPCGGAIDTQQLFLISYFLIRQALIKYVIREYSTLKVADVRRRRYGDSDRIRNVSYALRMVQNGQWSRCLCRFTRNDAPAINKLLIDDFRAPTKLLLPLGPGLRQLCSHARLMDPERSTSEKKSLLKGLSHPCRCNIP